MNNVTIGNKKRHQMNERLVKVPKMVAFHRPFRKLAKNAIILSGLLCLLYAHCWSRTLSLFKSKTQDGAGAVCRAVFTTFVQENENGASESSIWYLWSGALFIMIISFAQDEWNGLHYQEEDEGHNSERRYSMSESDDNEYVHELSETNSGFNALKGGFHSLSNYLSEVKLEGPKDTLDMVCMFSLRSIGIY